MQHTSRPNQPPVRQRRPAPVRSAEARLVRRRFILLQLATIVFSAIAGAVVADVLVPDPADQLARTVGIGSWPWLVAFALVFSTGSVLTLSLASRLTRQIDEAIRARRLEAMGVPAAILPAAPTELPPNLLDNLTGLGNHRAFHEALDRNLRVASRNSPLSLALLDLDDFKSVNDSGGHARGDEVLIDLTRMLRKVLRRSDVAFRIGGDEFAILLPATRAEDAAAVLQRLLAVSIEPRPGPGAPRGYSFSAGISDAPARAVEHYDLVDQAEHALFEGKRTGRTTVRTYDPAQQHQMEGPAMRRAAQSVVDLVRTASLTPVYQPIVDIRSGRVVGFEGLVRPVPGSGFEDPGSLFAVAEATGRTADLDRLCVQTLVTGAKQLAADQTLSLNLSPHTLEAPEFSVSMLVRLLASAGFEPGRIVLELTERQAITDIDALRRHLTACQAAGFCVAVDDVGAGNAGLRLLSQLHFDTVKIDVSLVHAGAKREASLEVLRSLSELAARWGAKAVAEGVETPSQLRMVRDLGLAEVQGYLLGAPSPSAELRHVALEPLFAEPSFRATLGFSPAPASPLG